MALVVAAVVAFAFIQGLYVVRIIQGIFPNVKESKLYKLGAFCFQSGPVIIYIISSIVVYFLALLKLNFADSHPRWQVIAHGIFAVYLWLNVAFNYFAAMIRPAGAPPKQRELYEEGYQAPEGIEFCELCNRLRTYGTHHCSKCQSCFRMRCHHSYFINNCIGLGNYLYYFRFLLFSTVALAYGWYMTYTPYHACYIHNHTKSDISIQYPALNYYVCRDFGEIPLLFVAVLIASMVIWPLFLFHIVLLAADLSTSSFIKYLQNSKSTRSFIVSLTRKCCRRQRRIKLNILVRNRVRSWMRLFLPTFIVLPDEITIDDVIDSEDGVHVQMI